MEEKNEISALQPMQGKLNLYQKLLEIQKRVVGLGKDGKSFGYQYVTGAKILEHVKPLMNDYGILLKQEVLEIDNTRQDYSTKQGAKSEILTKVTMRFTWIDAETGEKDVNEFGANGQNDWEKGLGSALTYAERYFLLKYFHISTDEDDIDNPERKPLEAAQPAKAPQQGKATAKQENAQQAQGNGPVRQHTAEQRQELLDLLKNPAQTEETIKRVTAKMEKFTYDEALKSTIYLKKQIAQAAEPKAKEASHAG